MASSQQPKGRGRGRQRILEASSLSNDASIAATPKKTDVDISSTTDDVQTLVTSVPTTIGRGRGRTTLSKRQVEVPHSQWTVSDLTIDQFKSNVRPSKPVELGRTGEHITVIVNYFPITRFPQEGLVYQYDIEIRNKRDRLIRREHLRTLYKCWLKGFCENYPEVEPSKIVFDNQKAIFTYDQPLPGIDNIGTTQKIIGPNLANRQEEYEISVKQVREPVDLSLLRFLIQFYNPKSEANINVDDLQSVKQMLSVVLHEQCSSQADFIFNRSFFSQPLPQDRHNNWDLGLGKAVWRGFYSCLVFAKGTHQLMMNLDISHRVFTTKQPFLDFLREVMLHSPCGKWRYGGARGIRKVTMNDVLEFFDRNNNHDYYDGEVEFLLQNCNNLSVRSHVIKNIIRYGIHGLGEAASRQTFMWKEENAFVTVEYYYEKHYRINLEYPALPTLRMHNGSFVPMEFIEVEPVKVKKITDEQRAILCLKSSQEPRDRYQSIKEVRQNPTQQCFDEDPFLAAWNLNVDVNMITVPARVLPMPDIICNDHVRVAHKQCRPLGVWNNTKTEFYKPTSFPSVWALINLSLFLDREACKAFYHDLSKVAVDRGMQCPEPIIYEEYDVRTRSITHITDALKEVMEENNGCKFFMVMLPEDNPVRDRIYGYIKELCELESGFGIVTQMIVRKKTEGSGQWNYSRLHNILQKINTKLNGINSIVDVHPNIRQFFSRGHRIMYVGVDLSHPAPGSHRRRSSVAVVASVGEMPVRYFKEVYVQDRPSSLRKESVENVVKMKEIMKSLISQYKDHQGYPPNAIIIYRDGISNSEFDTVFENELMAVREACVELSSAYRPYLTYIVVNKRHHTRFFPDNSKDNVRAGTVVDSHDVTNPTTYDFYLNSHHGRKGTSRPTHYHVLYDDNKLEPDQVQMLTYALCYLHARCASSISIPAPVKYADLLAFRATTYGKMNEESSTEPLPEESPDPINQDENVTKTIQSERIVLSSKLEADCPFFL